jgi:hypothetical protein
MDDGVDVAVQRALSSLASSLEQYARRSPLAAVPVVQIGDVPRL